MSNVIEVEAGVNIKKGWAITIINNKAYPTTCLVCKDVHQSAIIKVCNNKDSVNYRKALNSSDRCSKWELAKEFK